MGRVIQVPLKRILRMVNLVPQSISTFLGRWCRTTSHSQSARCVTACDERVCKFPVRIENGRTSAKSHQGSFFCAGSAHPDGSAHTGETLMVTSRLYVPRGTFGGISVVEFSLPLSCRTGRGALRVREGDRLEWLPNK